MAINISRAERFAEKTWGTGNTEDLVAPGSYNVPLDGFKTEGERPVPFSSGVDKVCCPNLGTSGLTPGPGTYVGQPNNHHEASGLGPCSFKSKIARIGPSAPGSSVYCESTVHKNPGPGAYGTKTEWELALKMPSRPAANPWREAPDKTVPSIPPQKLPPGAQPENAMGADMSSITMNHTGESGDTAGPGEYDPQLSLTTRSRPQTSFQTGGKERDIFDSAAGMDNRVPPKDNPGPGSYTAANGIGELKEGEVEKNSYQFASKTVLSHQKDRSGKGAPGPGQYDMITYMEKQVARARAHSNTFGDRTRFGSAVQRTGWSRSVDQPFVDPYHVHNVPGPGSYPSNAGVFPSVNKEKEENAAKAVPGNKKKKFYGVHHPMIVMALQETQGPLEAFGSTDDRNCNKVMAQTTPSPWNYDTAEARGASMAAELREKKKLGRHGAFGTLADRFFGSALSGRDDLPDPGGMGDSDENVGKSQANSEPRSMFVSQTPRMQSAPGGDVHAVRVGNTDTPAPGTYNIEGEINYRSPFRHPRSDHLSFGSGQGRFDMGSDMFAGEAIPTPAPGDYSARLPRRGGNGAAEIKDKRKMGPAIGSTNPDVGPGSYGTIDTPMLRKTFNVSTQAPASFSKRTPRKEFKSSDSAF